MPTCLQNIQLSTGRCGGAEGGLKPQDGGADSADFKLARLEAPAACGFCWAFSERPGAGCAGAAGHADAEH